MKMYFYQCPTKPELRGWFPDMNKFRASFFAKLKPSDVIIRCAHTDIEPPKGWNKPNGNLACDAIERIPTMRSLIHALTH
jgi:hypothetical protein